MESRERNSINYNNNPPQSNQDSSPRLNTRRNETLNHLIFKLHTEKLEPQRYRKNQPPSQPPPPPPPSTTVTPVVRYRECLKNHAANMGTHVLDGCGEFMPSGEDETLEALKCAACECHRSFHRREVEGDHQSQYSSHHIHHMAPPPRTTAVHLPPAPSTQQQRYHHRSKPPIMMAFGGSNGESSSEDFNIFQLMTSRTSKKRFRTKFSQEQKEKMVEFAERIEWKIQKQNEEDVLRFCNEIGLKSKVFKVWMHNNRQVAKKK